MWVAFNVMTERASSKAKAWLAKLYWPPTPLTTCPSARPSDTTAPSMVAIIALLMNRALTRPRRLASSSPYSSLVKDTAVMRSRRARRAGISRRRAIERPRTQEERRMQQCSVHFAFEHVGIDQGEERGHEHFA